MEMGIGHGEIQQIATSQELDFMVKGKEVVAEKQKHEWDSNEWKWDGNLFVAERLSIDQSGANCKERLPGDVGDRRDSEKRRKLSALEGDEAGERDDSPGLRLGGGAYPSVEREGENSELKNRKSSNTKLSLPSPSLCQVDGCDASLRDAKDYHRRHKVCEKHAKSAKVLLGGSLQRFCQQCSRFHLLQEFDEERRSCRRRLAGHNRRRRKSNLDTIASGHPLNDDHARRCIAICLLQFLSNLHSKSLGQSKDQDILFQLLQMLSGPVGTTETENLSRQIQSSQRLQEADTLRTGIHAFLSSPLGSTTVTEPSQIPFSTGMTSSIINCQDTTMAIGHSTFVNVNRAMQAQVSFFTTNSLNENAEPAAQDSNALHLIKNDPKGRQEAVCSIMPSAEAWHGEKTKSKLNDFDLNNAYSECEGDKGGLEIPSHIEQRNQAYSSDFPSWLHQGVHRVSPAHTSGNSESTSDKSLSSSSKDVQCCTDRIIFKLFGKDPTDLPHVLRTQILNWLSHSPTDIESYIRPGCIILTIYLRLPKEVWRELHSNLASSLKRLLKASDNAFWRTGWICTKVWHQLAFVYNGVVLLDTQLLGSQDIPVIMSVTPIAVDLCAEAVFTVKGTHLTSGTKVLCSFNGQQSVHEVVSGLQEENDSSADSFDQHNNEIQILKFTCSFSNMSGRGFIEVEDHDLSSGFFPFIVAEHDICSELRTLESSIEIMESASCEMRSRGEIIDFVQEFGWLLQGIYAVSRSDCAMYHSMRFSRLRLKWLLEFSIERDWCAVVRKILNVLFSLGWADYSVEKFLSEVSPLHRAVRRNCRAMVEFLLNYTPEDSWVSEANANAKCSKKVFKSNIRGLEGITPLHVAASIEGANEVLNLLTNDEEQDWIQTWEKVCDVSGFTPKDYARQRGHDSYIQLVQKKISSKASRVHLILDMTDPLAARVEESLRLQGNSIQCKKNNSFDIDSRSTEQVKCRACEQLSVHRHGQRVLHYRPAILSVLAIAAICACVSVLLKSPPEVLYVVAFRWELLDYGYI